MPGAKGVKGETGSDGHLGLKGEAGVNGEKGDKGDRGQRGELKLITLNNGFGGIVPKLPEIIGLEISNFLIIYFFIYIKHYYYE